MSPAIADTIWNDATDLWDQAGVGWNGDAQAGFSPVWNDPDATWDHALTTWGGFLAAVASAGDGLSGQPLPIIAALNRIAGTSTLSEEQAARAWAALLTVDDTVAWDSPAEWDSYAADWGGMTVFRNLSLKQALSYIATGDLTRQALEIPQSLALINATLNPQLSEPLALSLVPNA